MRTCRCAFVCPGRRGGRGSERPRGCRDIQRPRRESGGPTQKCPTTFPTRGLKFCEAPQSTFGEVRSTPVSGTPALHGGDLAQARREKGGGVGPARGARDAGVARGAGAGGAAGLPSPRDGGAAKGPECARGAGAWAPARCAPPPPARRPRVRREPRASWAPARPLPPSRAPFRGVSSATRLLYSGQRARAAQMRKRRRGARQS